MKDPRPCSIADSLAVVGEKHSLLVLREVFLGVRRFDAMVRNIGAPRDILAARLRRLVEAGVLEKVPYSERPRRFEYRPTQAGWELQPVLLMLMKWGDRHLAERPPVVLEHSCGAELEPVMVCGACGERASRDTLTHRVEAPGWTTTGPEAG
ncbi:helix-turn-helix domain-containing protein [Streptomyces sp. NBS 14/10]|uniref:winged helix-turn-helix transcriptional regulator n=1 Tax=Streptomyces sp. NBS 14/10 TaxID=1945643 RepID=UPI000B800891|nr:helix-turn-helix domain-containing protein [Streptomyces sp. NBS 14/10]KAK1184649.1 helix-turn-helix domain-containing protein [Streptomyces sp. NBS 14/10]NUS85700.1 helix-turn-helix transcriptional regulator [Streptomyces sp.]